MSKGKKKLGRVLLNVLSCVVLCAIVIPLSVALLLSLPRVQTYLGVLAARFASEYVSTEVSLGGVGIKNLKRVEISDFCVKDYYGDTVIYVERATASIDRAALLFKGQLSVGDVEASGAYVSIYKPLEGKDNITQIIDRINEKNGSPEPKPFSLENISVTNSEFRYRDEKNIRVLNGIDYTDMRFTQLKAKSKRISIVDKRFECDLYDVSGVEKSGVRVDNLSTRNMVIDEGLLTFTDTRILTEGAEITVPQLDISAPTWTAYESFADSVDMHVVVRNSKLNVKALNRFVSGVPALNIPVSRLSAEYNGRLNRFKIDISSADIASSTQLMLSAEVGGITAPADARFDIASLNLQSDSEELEALYRTAMGEAMPQEVAKYLSKCGNVWLKGSAAGTFAAVDSDIVMVADVGRIDIDGRVEMPRSGDFSFNGTVSASDLNAGEILDDDKFGKTAFVLNSRVALADGRVTDSAGRLDVSRLQFGGYTYSDLHLDAGYSDSELTLSLVSLDRNMRLSFDGNCNFTQGEELYDFLLDVQGVDFERVGLSSKRSWLACNMEASGRGFTLEELEFRAMVNNLVYVSPADTLLADVVNVVAGGGDGRKSVSLYSSLLDAEYRSTESYNDVLKYFTGLFLEQFPLLGDGVPQSVPDADMPLNSSLTVNLKSDSFVASFVEGLNVSPETSLYFAFNPVGGGYSFSMESGFAEWDDYLASNVTLVSDNLTGRTAMRLDIDELFALGTKIPEITVETNSLGLDVEASLVFGDTSSTLNGSFGFDVLFGRSQSGGLTARGSIADSHIATETDLWVISADGIDYADGTIAIDSFYADCGDQSIFVSGEISDRSRSTLEVRLENLDLGTPAAILFGDKLSVAGRLNGYARVGSLLRNPNGSGELTLSEVDIDGVKIDPLQLTALMSSADRVDIALRNMKSGDVVLNGNYNIANKSYEAGISVANMDFALLNPLLSELVTDSQGHASVDLKIEGTGKRPEIFGSIEIDDLITKIVPTGVEYRAEPIQMVFNRNTATLRRTGLVDMNNSRAFVEGSVDLKDLSDVSYNLRVQPDNFRVLGTDAESGSNLYGDLFVSGAVDISGNRSGTFVDAVIRTESGSVVSLLVGGSTDFSGTDYIKFVDRRERAMVDTTNIIELKRLQFDLKKNTLKPKKNIEITAMLQVGTDTEVRLVIDPATDNVLSTRGTADLNITLNAEKNDFQIRGDYQITEGSYKFNFENIISKDFTINSGSYIRWNGGLLDADIDISAVYRLKTSLAPLLDTAEGARSMTSVDCIINLKNRLSAIDMSFAINVPNANAEYQSILSSYFSSQEMMATQFVYLLALGTFYSENDTTTQGTAFGSAAGSAIGLGFLTSQVSRLLSNDSYNFNLKYKQKNLYSSSAYGVDFQTELIDDRLLLELEANVDTGDNATATDISPLSGGGSLTLLLDRTGNLIMKGFSRTIDRFDENQGLQESGVGIYYGRSFNRFGDLFRKNRDKSATKSRSKQKK